MLLVEKESEILVSLDFTENVACIHALFNPSIEFKFVCGISGNVEI